MCSHKQPVLLVSLEIFFLYETNSITIQDINHSLVFCHQKRLFKVQNTTSTTSPVVVSTFIFTPAPSWILWIDERIYSTVT